MKPWPHAISVSEAWMAPTKTYPGLIRCRVLVVETAFVLVEYPELPHPYGGCTREWLPTAALTYAGRPATISDFD